MTDVPVDSFRHTVLFQWPLAVVVYNLTKPSELVAP